jgi:phosphoribosylanthranilate isomerase
VRRTRVKICGIRHPDDAKLAAEAGADAVGVILHAPGAKRLVESEAALKIVAATPPMVTTVGVVVDASPFILRQLLAVVPVDLVQFHGKEKAADVLAALPRRATKVLAARDDLAEVAERWLAKPPKNLAGLHIDSAAGGGSGKPANWEAVAQLPAEVVHHLTLAGGLTPDNVGDVVRRFRPWAVDVSSGVEDDSGRKSPQKVQTFIDAVRAADEV